MPNEQRSQGSRTIPASPQVIFDVIANPHRHAEFDGSGTVNQAQMQAPDRLTLGSKFGMKMRILGFPYRMSSKVVEFEENRLIAWAHFGKHRWRYELEPVDGGTKVTETFDYSYSLAPWFIERAGYPQRHVANIEQTLERLDALVTAK